MVILDVRKETCDPNNINLTMTVEELIDFLHQLPENEQICFGSVFLSQSEGWHWYSSIQEADFKEVEFTTKGDIALIGDAW